MKKGLIISFLIVCKFTFAQNKIGIVNFESLLERLPSRDSVMKLIKEREATYLDELSEMDSAFFVLMDKVSRCHRDVDFITKLYEENQMKSLQDDIFTFQMEMDRKIQHWGLDCNEKASKIIRQAIERVSLNLGLSAVLDESKVMYFTDELNITELVFTEMVKIDQTAE